MAPQNDLSFVKDENTVGKNIARNGHKVAILSKVSRVGKLSGKIEIFAFCVVTFEPIKI